MSVLPAAQLSDNLRMGAAIQSEPAAAEPDPAETLLTGRADSKGLEVLTEPGVDPGDEMSLPARSAAADANATFQSRPAQAHQLTRLALAETGDGRTPDGESGGSRS